MKLTLVLDHACNLRCSYCYAGRKLDRRMCDAVALAALDLAFERPRPYVRVGLFGGEPLLAPELIDRVARQARERAERSGTKLRLTLTSNGTLLDEELLALLRRHKIWLTISLDGDREGHDLARRSADGEGSWERAVAGLRLARERLGSARTLSVLHPGNAHLAGRALAFVAAEGVDQASFYVDFGATWDEAALERLEQGTNELVDRAIELFRAGRDLVLRPLHGKIVTRIKGDLAPRRRCGFGQGELAVAPSGRLYPCERLVGDDGPDRSELVIGHVFEGLDDAKVCGMSRVRDLPRPDCQGCALLDRCSWSCGCVNHAITGSVDGGSGLLCRVEQLSIAAADRLAATLYAEANPLFLRRYYQAAAGRLPLA
jgi:uncharacterized protein